MKKVLSWFLAFVMVFSSISFSKQNIYAAQPIWNSVIFGDGINSTDVKITVESDAIILESLNDKGKISSNKDGIAFYYSELNANSDFIIKVKATVSSFVANNQVSFGLMLRDTIGENGVAGTDEIKGARMLGVGGLNQKIQAFSRATEKGNYTQDSTLENKIPASGSIYDLIIKKSGNLYELICNGNTLVKEYTDIFTDNLFAGIYTARNTKITYSNLSLTISKEINNLEITKTPKTEYLQNQSLDLTGLELKANYSDGTNEIISNEDIIVTGFDSSGLTESKTVTISYGGKSATYNIRINDITCTEIKLEPIPAKTTYYIDDVFDSLGMVVKAKFDSGEEKELQSDEYTISGFDSSTAGKKTITIEYIDKSVDDVKATFEITVLSDTLTSLNIAKQPTKTVYYLGEQLDTKGLAVKAVYGAKEILLATNEYTIDTSNFDTITAGQKTITIKYKNQTANINLTVKQREVTGIIITTIPKTTYIVGEGFDSTGIVVSKLYDNGDKTDITEYTINSSAFDGTKAGVYKIIVIPTDTSLSPISFDVTVREAVLYEWKSIAFGQSISLDKNIVSVSEDKITVTALEGGGKVTNSGQDGISYYYTELNNTQDNFELSADIKVIEFAKPTPDNQEAFGIMARDGIGTNGDSSIFASNIAMVGGYRGVTQFFVRSGVQGSTATDAGACVNHENILDSTRPTINNTYPIKDYKLTLKKTNSGYIGQINNGKEVLVYEPDVMGIQNSTLYVGFFAARLATIEVSNVKLTVTSTATDAPKVELPAEPIKPTFNIVSLDATSTTNYDLKLSSNVNGTVTIKQDETLIATDLPIAKNQILTQSTNITANAVTNFTAIFTPDTDQNLTSFDRIVKTKFVTMKTYGADGEAIYVSPQGTSNATGSKENPLDINTAINYVKQGQTIYMLEGTYKPTSPVSIQPGNNGTVTKTKTLAAYNGAKVIIDFDKKVSGFTLDGDYWKVFGIDVTNAPSTGFRVGGNHNIVELCNVYNNGDTGLQLSRYGDGGYNTWPSYNLILNCTAYDNIDPAENNADGFAAKLTVGDGNVFRGCIAYNNCDDAWDLFAKGSTGVIGAVTIENSIAYGNGTLSNGYKTKGDGNGFKLGGEGIAVPHVIKNSISFNNNSSGFTSNSNPSVISENCVSYNNSDANFDWRVYTNVIPLFVATGNISYKSAKGTKDTYPQNLISETNYYYDGNNSVNKSGKILTDENFKSLVVPSSYNRDSNGNIIWGDFLKFINTSNKPLELKDAITAANVVLENPNPRAVDIMKAISDLAISIKAYSK